MGDMKISNGKVTYTSGNSWNTILDEIADIKQAMNPVYSFLRQPTQSVLPIDLKFPLFRNNKPLNIRSYLHSSRQKRHRNVSP